jgi:hypothetical protein
VSKINVSLRKAIQPDQQPATQPVAR